MRSFVDSLLKRMHHGESGAIMLVLLAAFLILFMLALTLYDAGQSAQNKMDAQISADASAFTHEVIKSRSMNMIVYANIIKRMFFSYAVTYINGITALVLTVAYHASQCFRLIPNPRSCWELGQNVLLYVSEFAEAFVDIPTLSILPRTSGRAAPELEALEKYQQYMYQITPWWAWSENVLRSMNNGAMATASWPPPAGNIIEEVKSFALGTASVIDWGLGTDILGMLPSLSTAVDAMPVTRRDRQKDWTSEIGPFRFDVNASSNTFLNGVEYCAAWTGSMEFFINTVQTYTQSDDSFQYFLELFLFLQAFGGSVGCVITNLAWNSSPLQGAHFDWKINTPDYENDNDWLQATSTITYSYVPRAGRNSNEGGERQKFTYMSEEANLNELLFRNEGYFAMARAELTYKPAFATDFSFASLIGSIPLVGSRLGLQPEPDMWSPRWTAKLRPVGLPGETLKAATYNAGGQGDSAGFNTIVGDTIPYLVMGAGIGGLISGERFGVQSSVNDLFYLWRASRTMRSEETMAVGK